MVWYGFDGGLPGRVWCGRVARLGMVWWLHLYIPANFLLELYDAAKMELKQQVTNNVPVFEVQYFTKHCSALPFK